MRSEMTTAMALAHLGLLEMPASRADLQRQLARRQDPRRWSAADAAAYRCLWGAIGRATRTPKPEQLVLTTLAKASAGRPETARAHGVYRPGMTRR